MKLMRAIELYKSGDQQAFSFIYNETKHIALCAIYRYTQNKNDIDDICQNVYMKVANKIREYNNINFSNWIYTLAKNTAIDFLKEKKEIIVENVDFIPNKSTNPYLHYAIMHLDEKMREIFLMKVLYGHTTKKVSEILNCTPHEVNTIYNSCKRILKKSLEDEKYEI